MWLVILRFQSCSFKYNGGTGGAKRKSDDSLSSLRTSGKTCQPDITVKILILQWLYHPKRQEGWASKAEEVTVKHLSPSAERYEWKEKRCERRRLIMPNMTGFTVLDHEGSAVRRKLNSKTELMRPSSVSVKHWKQLCTSSCLEHINFTLKCRCVIHHVTAITFWFGLNTELSLLLHCNRFDQCLGRHFEDDLSLYLNSIFWSNSLFYKGQGTLTW